MKKETRIMDVNVKTNTLPEELWPEVNTLPKKKFKKNAYVYKEGEDSRFLFLILRGQAIIYTETYDGINIAFDILGPGEFIGSTFSQTWEKAEAIEELLVALIPVHDIVKGDLPKINSYLFVRNDVKIERLKKLIKLLHAGKAEEKVLRLLHFFHYNGYFLDPDKYIFADCSQIGAFTAMRRETVSRAFSELVRQGLIRKVGRKIELLKKKKNN